MPPPRPPLRSSLVLTLAAFGQALLLVAPHLAPEQVEGSAARKALLVPFVLSAAMVMAHHSPTRLTSQLCPVLHSGLQQLVSAPAAGCFGEACPRCCAVLWMACLKRFVFHGRMHVPVWAHLSCLAISVPACHLRGLLAAPFCFPCCPGWRLCWFLALQVIVPCPMCRLPRRPSQLHSWPTRLCVALQQRTARRRADPP